jgi:hypothetical protein
MRILMLDTSTKDYFRDTRWREQDALSREASRGGGELLIHGPGYDYWTNDVEEVIRRLEGEGRPVDVIVCSPVEKGLLGLLKPKVMDHYGLTGSMRRFPKGLYKIDHIPKILWINDFWHMSPSEWDLAILGHGFSHVLGAFLPPFVHRGLFEATYSERVRKAVKFHSCPRSVDPEVFKDYGEERSEDVTLLGAMEKPFYGLRAYFHECLLNQTGLKYFNAPHPGRQFNPRSGLTGEAYARAMARSKVFVACTSRFKLPFAKIFEALACGALLICDRPCGAEQLGLVDGQTYVEVDKHTFLPKLRYYLAHDDKRFKIAEGGKALFLSRHTVGVRAQEVLEILADILRDRASSPRGLPPSGTKGDPEWPPSPRTHGQGVIRKVERRLRQAGAVLLHGLPQAPHEPETAARDATTGTHLDWRWVTETAHIVELAAIETLRELSFVERFGLATRQGAWQGWSQHPELVALGPLFLQGVASALRATTLCEVGTGLGVHALLWAEAIEIDSSWDARIYMCDVADHDAPVFQSMSFDEHVWTRQELWALEPTSRLITFVHGDSSDLAVRLGAERAEEREIEMVVIGGQHYETGVLDVYENLRAFLAEKAVLVIEDCAPRFPGVETAVVSISAERDVGIQLVQFWPASRCMAVLGSPLSLEHFKDRRASLALRGDP